MDLNRPDQKKPGPRSRPGKQRIAAPHSIRQALSGILEDFSLPLEEMFSHVDDYFFDRSERAGDASAQEVYFDTMRTIRANRGAIATGFFDHLTASISSAFEGTVSGSRRSPRRSFRAESMAVLTEDEAEIEVAISSISQRCLNQFGTEIGTLIATLESVVGIKDASADRASHPLGPGSFARSFLESIRSLSLDIRAILGMLKLFERHVTDQLGVIYADALDRLEKQGSDIVRETLTDAHSTRQRSAARETVAQGVVGFTTLQRHLAGRVGYRSGPADASPDDPISLDHLIKTVTSAQGRFNDGFSVTGNADGQYPSLHNYLINLPNTQGGFRDAGKDEQDTLMLVSDMFEHIFQNEALSVASKALIARMQIPTLKVALVDRTIFSEPEHPARQLLNRIASDGIGWPPSEALLRRNPLYQAAEKLVADLNAVAKPDAGSFDELLSEWCVQVERHERKAASAIRRLNESVLGKTKLQAAKSIVQATVNEHAAGIELPIPIAAFLAGDWTQMMVVTCVKHGTDDESWVDLCNTLDDIVRIARPPGPEQSEANPDVDAVLTRVDELLKVRGSSRDGVPREFAATLRKVAEWRDSGYEVESLEIMEEIVLTDVEYGDEQAQDEYTDDYRLMTLEPGSWVEIDAAGESKPLRCRLAIVVQEAHTYVFTDDSGIKVREMHRKAILQGLVAGTVRIIRQESLVEKALDDLMASLKSYTPAPV